MSVCSGYRIVRREFEAKQRRIVQGLQQVLASAPDNPKIHRLDSRCFVLRFKDLGSNWSPEYHDWRSQYQYISDLFTTHSLGTALRLVVIVIRKGKLRIPSERHTKYFAPEVRKYLRSLYVGRVV